MKNLKLHGLAVLLFFSIGLLTYSNSLHSGFLIDDHAFFDEQKQNIKYILYNFIPDKDQYLGLREQKPDSFYRPLTFIIPMLSNLYFKDNVFGQHSVNLVLLCLAVFTIYMFIYSIFRDYLLAVLCGVFYIAHPINGILVNYITASVFPVEIIFMLLSLIFLWRSLESAQRFWRNALSVLFFLLAMLCHETAMALPFYAACLLFFVWKKGWRQTYLKALPLFITLVSYFFLRMHFASLNESIIHKFAKFHMNVFEYLASFSKLMFWYLGQLFYPKGVIFILAIDVARENVGLWIVGLLGLIALLGFLLRYFRNDRAASFGLSMFAVGFLPFTLACLFQPAHGPMCEPHWFVFPVIGFFLFITRVLTKVFIPENLITEKVSDLNAKLKFEIPRWKIASVYLLILIASWISVSRYNNYLWSDEVRYCRYWLKESPGFTAAITYLAKAHELRRQYKEARYYYQQSLIKPFKPESAYTNLGLIDMIEGDWDNAKANFIKALQFNPYISTAQSNLGAIYLKDGDYEKAKEYLLKSIATDRFSVLPRLNLGKVFLKEGKRDEAIQTFEEILKIVPHEENALIELIKIYISGKDKNNTLRIADELVEYSRNPISIVNAGVMLAYHGSTESAKKAFERSMQESPGYKEAYFEAAKVYAKQGDKEKTVALLRKAQMIDPSDKRFKKSVDPMNLFTPRE